MNVYKKFSKNAKAISPIFATLILIAIAVIAGVVVYMFTSGYLASMTNNTNAAQDKLAVSGASYDGKDLTVYVQNMQQTGKVTVTGLLVKDSSGNTAASVTSLTGTTFAQSDGLQTITGAASLSGPGTFTVTVTTAGGGSFVSPAFTYTGT
jgi:archaeal type IV pilus assembly protein PilA